MMYARSQKCVKKTFWFQKPTLEKPQAVVKIVQRVDDTLQLQRVKIAPQIFFYLKKITKTASHSTNLQVDTKIIRNLGSCPSL